MEIRFVSPDHFPSIANTLVKRGNELIRIRLPRDTVEELVSGRHHRPGVLGSRLKRKAKRRGYGAHGCGNCLHVSNRCKGRNVGNADMSVGVRQYAHRRNLEW